jgi:signal transduction histidine kinase
MRLSLHHRIVLPFAAVAVIAISAVAWVAYDVTSTTVVSRLRGELANATTLASRGGLASNPTILAAIKQATGSDVITFADGRVISTTLEGPNAAALAARVMSAVPGRPPNAGAAPAVIEVAGDPAVFASYRGVDGEPGTTISLLKETSDLTQALATLRNTIIGAAVLSFVVMIGAGQLVARQVTAPIVRLAAFAERVSTSHPNERAAAGGDEVGRLGAAFNDMLERLDAAQAAVVSAEKLGLAGLMAARVAHDVRNPLSSIKMQTQLLNATLAPGSESREMTEAMLHDISQVEFVVGGLLEVANPRGLQKSPQALNDIVDSVIRQVAPQCRHRQITVERRLAADLPVLWLDPDRLTHALLNVVLNSIEALREGGTLTVTSARSGAGDVLIVVDDDGVGIDAAAAARVFDPFVTTKPGGVGLGLVNARAAIESHGGTITLAPRQPAGTRATIRLPVTPPAGSRNG